MTEKFSSWTKNPRMQTNLIFYIIWIEIQVIKTNACRERQKFELSLGRPPAHAENPWHVIKASTSSNIIITEQRSRVCRASPSVRMSLCACIISRGDTFFFTINQVFNWISDFGSVIIVTLLWILAYCIVSICKSNDNLGNMVFRYINIFPRKESRCFFSIHLYSFAHFYLYIPQFAFPVL